MHTYVLFVNIYDYFTACPRSRYITTLIFIFHFQMDSEIKRVSDIFNKMPKFDWQRAQNAGVIFFSFSLVFFRTEIVRIIVFWFQN